MFSRGGMKKMPISSKSLLSICCARLAALGSIVSFIVFGVIYLSYTSVALADPPTQIDPEQQNATEIWPIQKSGDLPGTPVRIKDIARVLGVRSNQLMGYGLVIGLNGTGDSRQVIFTTQAISNMLNRFGITVDSHDVQSRNVAAVMVTCDLPPFVKNGDRIDVVVSSLGDSRSLEGGVLLLTPLQAPDGNVYAVAQGPVSLGGRGGTRRDSNFPTVAVIPNGAIIEKEVPTIFADSGSKTISITLNRPDFTMASRVAQAINTALGGAIASAQDGATVRATIPDSYSNNTVGFIAAIEELTVNADAVAKVVINERTGTVVIGGNVRLLPAVISHGNLRVQISGSGAGASHADIEPASKGATAATGATHVDTVAATGATHAGTGAAPAGAGATPKDTRAFPAGARMSPVNAGNVNNARPGGSTGSLFEVGSGGTVDTLVQALNSVGASPKDVIAVLQALRSAGSLLAEIEIL